MSGIARLLGMTVVAGLYGSAAFSEESPQIRARILATRLETEVAVELRNGQKWKGTLTDITENSFLVLAEPDKETQKRLRLSSGMKIKKNFAFDDVVALEGGVAAELVENYLVLWAQEKPSMQVQLTVAAAAGFRVRASAGGGVLLLEKVESGAASENVVVPLSGKHERDLDDWGAKGFRVVPGTLGSSGGAATVVLERPIEETGSRDYRVLATAREGTLEKELLAAVAQGYRVIGLTTANETVVLLESQAASAGTGTAPPEYRLSRLESAELGRQASDGFRLVACSDGERLCILERTSGPMEKDAYLSIVTAMISTFEKELNEAGGREYRLHPRTVGVEGELVAITEIFAVMEKSDSRSLSEYRVFSADHASKLQREIALAAREGFQVIVMSSGTKGTGLAFGVATAPSGVFVVMERATPK
jgi:hypothetical protein